MSSKKKQKKFDTEETKESLTEQISIVADTIREGSSKEEILKMKEERLQKENLEEEVAEAKPDTKLTRVLKSIGYFWDYYKWFVIIPTVIILIVVVFIDSYRKENRDFVLRIAIANETNVYDTLNTIDDEYPTYRGIDVTKTPIRIDYEFEYPKDRMVATNLSQSQVANMQKFNAMVVGGKSDVVISNTWLLDDYSVNKNMVDVYEVFDEEFVKENEDRIYWYIGEGGERIAVGFFVGDCEFLEEFANGEPAVISIFANAENTEEAAEFVKWILSKCSGDMSNWVYS